MKTHKFMFERITDIKNITEAIHRASKNKKKRKEVQKVLNNVDFYANEIQRILINKTFKHAKPKTRIIKEGSKQKERVITKINFFPEQIIHWALILQLSPIIEKSAYTYSCGSMPKKGVHSGKKVISKWVEKDVKHTKYVAKADIRKFYPSVKRGVIKNHLRTIVKDPQTLWLIDEIINSSENGLPIGYLTSQWFSNSLLQGLDYFIKQNLKVKYYVRYLDDIVMFGNNKKELHRCLQEIKKYLFQYNLQLKHNYQVFRFDKRFLDFMGFKFYRNRTTLRKSLMLRISRKVQSIYKKGYITFNDSASVISYLGWVKHSSTYGFFTNYIEKYLSISKLKNIIRMYSADLIGRYQKVKLSFYKKVLVV